MSDVPPARPVATPVAAPTVAMLGVPEVQLEVVVTLRDDPSLKVAVAVNGWVPEIGIEAVAGVTARETTAVKPEPKIGSRPPVHPAATATSSKAADSIISGLVKLLKKFIGFLRLSVGSKWIE